MTPDPQPALRLVDADGVLHEKGCPHCQEKDDLLAGLRTNLNGWISKYKKLERDKLAEMEASPYLDQALKWWAVWQRDCRHPNSEWDAECFFLIEPFLRSKKYGPMIGRAIAGAAFDPATKPRKNGSLERFDDWELIFRNRSKFESMVNRAPRSA